MARGSTLRAVRGESGRIQNAPVTVLILLNAMAQIGAFVTHGKIGASGRTRTCNLLIRSQKLYPIELPTPNAFASSTLPLAKPKARGRA